MEINMRKQKSIYFTIFFTLWIYTLLAFFWGKAFKKIRAFERSVRNTSPPNETPTEVFQAVDKICSMYVFSAYHDDREQNLVRVIGAWRHLSGQVIHIYCILWYSTGHSGNTSVAIVVRAKTELVDGRTKDDLLRHRFVAAYFLCPLPDKNIPYAVSVTTNLAKEPLNKVSVSTSKLTYKERRNFTVCVAPFHNNYSNTYAIVEWVEMNRILGAEKFIFYNLSMSRHVHHLVAYYVSQRLAEVVDWHLPLHDFKYYGQQIQLQDCLYRERYRTKYIVNIDLDEFIIPQQDSVLTWTTMLAKLPTVTEYIFHNSFFATDGQEIFPDEQLIRKYRLATLLRTKRQIRITPTYDSIISQLLGIKTYFRTKWIVDPSKVITANVHNINEMDSTDSVFAVSPSDGLLHHYRNSVTEMAVKQDKTMFKYKDELIKRIHSSWEKISNFTS